jgi:hypothetical protein
MSLNVTPTNAVQPPVVIQGNQVTLNCTFTIPETMFVAYVQGTVKRNLEAGNTLIYLGVSNSMQNGFNQWVANKFSSANLTPDQLRLTTLVTSVWTKTKAFVDNKLSLNNNQDEIADEMGWHQIATIQYADLAQQGHVGGKLFTVRQANVIGQI